MSSARLAREGDRFRMRVARATDARAIHDLETRVFATDRLSLRSIRRLIAVDSARVFVIADRHGLAAALAMLYRRGSLLARLYSLAVDPRCRARGVGSRLLAHAIERARRDGKSEVRLEVRRNNRQAQSFYAGHGFVPTGIRARYYQDGQHAFTYARATAPRALRA